MVFEIADAGEWPTMKNPTPILDSARSAAEGFGSRIDRQASAVR
jgi:hypothetical protein